MRLASALATLPARHGGHMYEDDGWRWMWGSVLMLLLIAVIIAVVWLLARGSSFGHRASDPGGSSATEVLAQRYARGEIDTEEYQERLAALTAWPSATRDGKARGRNRPDPPSG
jgi:putative membrane protein